MLTLLRLRCRRDRILLPVWVLVIAVMSAVTAAAVTTEFTGEAERAQLVTLALSSPALLAFRGIPNGFSAGSIVWFQVFTWLAVVVGLMNTLLATRHGRSEEADGRREMLGATPITRTAPMTATVLLGLAANVAVALLTGVALIAGGLDVSGSLLTGAALGASGIAFLGVGLLAGQLMSTARGANSVGTGVVLLSYLLRAAGDMTGSVDLAAGRLHPAAASLFSPIGWGERVLAFTDNQALWLLPIICFGLLTGLAAVTLNARRDLGAALVPERVGRSTARGWLASPLGLAWRQQWPILIAWVIGAAVLGATIGSLARSAGSTLLDNPQIVKVLQSVAPDGSSDPQDTLVLLLVTAVMSMVCMLATAAGIQAVLRWRTEEVEGRAEVLLATPTSRIRSLASTLAVALVTVVAVLVAAGVAAAITLAAGGSSGTAGRTMNQALVQIPAAATLVVVAALAVAALPKACVAIAWAVFGLAAVLSLFGDLLSLPGWLITVSPFADVPSVPVSDWLPLELVTAIGSVIAAAALSSMRRRQVPT